MKRTLFLIYVVIIALLWLPLSFVYGGIYLVGRGHWHPSRAHLKYLQKLIDKINPNA